MHFTYAAVRVGLFFYNKSSDTLQYNIAIEILVNSANEQNILLWTKTASAALTQASLILHHISINATPSNGYLIKISEST